MKTIQKRLYKLLPMFGAIGPIFLIMMFFVACGKTDRESRSTTLPMGALSPNLKLEIKNLSVLSPGTNSTAQTVPVLKGEIDYIEKGHNFEIDLQSSAPELQVLKMETTGVAHNGEKLTGTKEPIVARIEIDAICEDTDCENIFVLATGARRQKSERDGWAVVYYDQRAFHYDSKAKKILIELEESSKITFDEYDSEPRILPEESFEDLDDARQRLNDLN